MILSDVGKVCEIELYNTAELRDNVILDEYIVMPDHIHAIIVITDKNVEASCRVSNIENNEDDFANHETRHSMSPQCSKNWQTNRFGAPVSGSLSIIINQFK